MPTRSGNAATRGLAREQVTPLAHRVVARLLLSTILGATVAAAQPVRAPAQAITQGDTFDCGVAALATVLTLHQGREVMPRALINALPMTEVQHAVVKERGYSLYELARMAQAVGAKAGVYRLDAHSLERLPLPSLVYLSLPTGPHFSVVTDVVGESVALADPSRGFMIWPKAQFLAAWAPSGKGYTVTVTADPDASA
ncbi:MAG: cysteine peptidase family C39 domain-containing protein [Luminiphilus sp.]|jgi:predicted double-glycine peptidase